jgi:predicted Zn-dependent peptidase
VISPPDVDVERQVILEEISMRDDDPEDTLGDAFAAAVYTGHPVADPVIGTEQTITDMTRSQIAGYYKRRYSPDKMVIAAAGGIDHADVVRWVRKAFAGRLEGDQGPRAPRSGSGRIRPVDGMLVVERDTEQAHLCIGVPALHRTDPRRPVLGVLAAALGGGMSSRLFRTIREENGLAYSCYASTSAYADIGSFSVYAGCQPDNLGKVSDLIGQELRAVAERGLEPAELARVKGQLTGGFLLGLEDTESRMSRIGKNLLVRSDYRSVAEELAAVHEVSTESVTALARELLTRPLSGAVVGPYASPEDLPAELRDLTATRPASERQRRRVG